MTENSGLLLNLASIPIKRKKNKSTTNNVGVQEKPFIGASIQPKIKAAHSVQPKPKKMTKSQSKLLQVVRPKLSKPTQAEPSEPTGILKKNLQVPSQSVWKKFKASNKGRDVNDFASNKSKPEFLARKRVKVKDKSDVTDHQFKKVSFNETNLKTTLNDSNEFTSRQEFSSISHKNTKQGAAADDYSFETDLVDDNSDFGEVKKKSKKPKCNEGGGKPIQEFHHTPDSKREYNTGKTTSLFHNNPDIPEIAHRAVHPVKEDVFSNVSFDSLNLHPFMVKYLKESMGLITTTTVQAKAIPILLNNKDALVRSQTGSGKTLAFALPILHKLQEVRPKINRSQGVMALIVLPTRELALQTYEVFNKLIKSYTWIVPGYLVGGEKRKSEKARLRKGITILIGTPGRLIDHIRHTKALKLDKVEYLVIDEADRLLDMGYEKDVSVLLDALNSNSDSSLLQPDYLCPEKPTKNNPKTRQTILLSATLSPKVQKLAGLSLRDPVFVDACEQKPSSVDHVPILGSDLGTETDTMVLPESLVQKYLVIPPKLKLVTLAAFILQSSKVELQKKMLIFVGTQDMVDYYTDLLSAIFGTSKEDNPTESEDLSHFSSSGVELLKLHGSMKQSERTEVFKTFRKSSLGVLLCTDVAARGLDLPEVDWVIQFTGPISVSDYVHRVGRTARGGQSGSSIIFLTPNEVSFIGKLENCQIRVQEEKMDNCLNHLARGRRTAEEEATKLQLKLEKLVADDRKLYDLACKAYASWSRFYASYPKNMRDAFSVKSVHQGHHAKSFALRESPTAIVDYARKKNLNEKRFPRKRLALDKTDPERKRDKYEGKGKLQRISEFDSGLEPLPKKKKKNERLLEK